MALPSPAARHLGFRRPNVVKAPTPKYKGDGRSSTLWLDATTKREGRHGTCVSPQLICSALASPVFLSSPLSFVFVLFCFYFSSHLSFFFFSSSSSKSTFFLSFFSFSSSPIFAHLLFLVFPACSSSLSPVVISTPTPCHPRPFLLFLVTSILLFSVVNLHSTSSNPAPSPLLSSLPTSQLFSYPPSPPSFISHRPHVSKTEPIVDVAPNRPTASTHYVLQ